MNDARSTHWVGFDLGGTKMLATIFDKDFRSVGRKRKKTKGYEGSGAGVERIFDTLKDALADADLTVDRIRGIGIGCPGPVDLQSGTVIEAVNLGWQDVPLRQILEKKLSVPTFVVNDVDAGVYAENRFGAAKGARTVVGMFPGTGIGGGCVYNGEILHGERCSALEIGHIQVIENGPICGCGRQGCLETVASRLAIAAEVAKAAYRGEAPSIMESVGTHINDIRSGVLAKAVKDGEKTVEKIIKIAARYMGVALADVVSLLVPDMIVLGGGLVEAMPKLLSNSIGKSLDDHVMPAFRGTYKIVTAELADDASVLGAAAWAAREVRRRNESKT